MFVSRIGEGSIIKSFHHWIKRWGTCWILRCLSLSINDDRSLASAYCPLDLQREGNVFVGPLPLSANIVYGSAGFKTTKTPPEGAERNIKGPLLFKSCRVDYNKKTNRLEIRKGEYIGKTLYGGRKGESPSKAEGGEYYDTIVNCNLDEIDFQGEISICIIKRTTSMTHHLSVIII